MEKQKTPSKQSGQITDKIYLFFGSKEYFQTMWYFRWLRVQLALLFYSAGSCWTEVLVAFLAVTVLLKVEPSNEQWNYLK